MTTKRNTAFSPPIASKDLLQKLIKQLKKDVQKDRWYLAIEWKDYIDAEWISSIASTSFERNRLILSTSSSIFAHHFQYIKQDLVAKLQSRFPDKLIRDVRCKIQ